MKALLLAPKHSRDGTEAIDVRPELAAQLATVGHQVATLESEPDATGETLRHKFLRLALECDHVVFVWPPGAAMATTADELILLQEAYDASHIRIILILHESEVEERGHELHVHFPADQSRYLDGILHCSPYLVWWKKGESFSHVLHRYADQFL